MVNVKTPIPREYPRLRVTELVFLIMRLRFRSVNKTLRYTKQKSQKVINKLLVARQKREFIPQARSLSLGVNDRLQLIL